MRVLFLNIYPRGLTRYLLSSYVLIRYLKENRDIISRLQIKIVNVQSEENINEIIKKYEYEVLCLSCYVWNRKKVLELTNCVNNKVIVFGGPDVSESFIQEVTDTNINYFIYDEGEKKIEFLFGYLLGLCCDENFELLPISNKRNSFVVESLTHDCITSFFPVYSENMLEDGLIRHQTVLLETQRGCLFHCSFCNYNKSKKMIRYSDLDCVFSELEFLTIKKAKEIRIADAVFTSNLSRAKKIIRFMVTLKEKYNYIPTLFLETYIQCIDDEFISLLGQMDNNGAKIYNIRNLKDTDIAQMYSNMILGYKCILCVGVQSLNPIVLKACNRYDPTIKKIQDSILAINKYNIVLKIDLILGLPMETKESYLDGLRKLIPVFDGRDHILNIHILKVLPNTTLMDNYKEYNIVFDNDKNNVIETGTIDRETMFELKKITAILFRVINSRFREDLFLLLNSGIDLYDLLLQIEINLKNTNQLPKLFLEYNEVLDDDYWNTTIFQDIKSISLDRILHSIKNNNQIVN